CSKHNTLLKDGFGVSLLHCLGKRRGSIWRSLVAYDRNAMTNSELSAKFPVHCTRLRPCRAPTSSVRFPIFEHAKTSTAASAPSYRRLGGVRSSRKITRLLVELHRRLAEEHEIRWHDRDRPIDAEDRDFDLVTGLDGIGDDDPVRDVEALDRGRASDADAARYLPVDPHFGVVVYVGSQHRLGVRGVEGSNLGRHCQVGPVPQERQFTAATPVQQLLGLKGQPRGIVEAL